MNEANFGEAQLQSLVNAAIVDEAYVTSGQKVFAIIPTLPEEHGLGWDTAFSLPDVPLPSLAAHKGCNFFIQYKLSQELVSANAGQYESWNSPYYRFRIPHNGSNGDDFHQWSRLRSLAQQGYPTYYATNAVLTLDSLLEAMQTEQWPSVIPFLDVADVKNQHVHVTFTPQSPHFVLHSEKEEVPVLYWPEIARRVASRDADSLDAGNARLRDTLLRLSGKENQYVTRGLREYEAIQSRVIRASAAQISVSEFAFLGTLFQEVLGFCLARLIHESVQPSG